ncbi:MAG TPA: rhodanese-like domain-containing protein [Tepidisphaeraceae bacterium]|nr:rhodanese-like domain-containing protein [Tepidisphaeraceae bacterium]
MAATNTVKTVPAAEVSRLQSQGRPIDLIDVRTPAEFAAVHAEGARLVPLDRLDPRAVLASRAGSADEPVYLICRSGARAARACEVFAAAGFANAVSVEGGTAGWEQAGLPVVRGEARVIPLERQVRIAAGLLVLLGVGLGWLVHPAFFGLSAFVGAGLVFAGVTDWCGMGMVLARMPWNQRGPGPVGGAPAGGGEACHH